MTEMKWAELVEIARWAPSPHNIQPWKIRVLSETRAELFYDPTRLLPGTDPTGRFTMVGFGIFLEFLKIIAASQGQQLRAEYNGQSLDARKPTPTKIFELELLPGGKADSLSPELILQRQTSRLRYNGRPVGPAVLAELKSIAKTYHHVLTTSSEASIVEWTLRLNRDTLFYDMEDEVARNEVGGWIRYNGRDAQNKKDGLWSYCLGMPGWLLFIFVKMQWLFHLPILYQLVKRYYLSTTTGTRTISWVQGRFSTLSDALNAGHMLGRLWLTMTRHNVVLHPFGSIITNQKAHEILRQKFGAHEGETELWLIMRLGYSAKPPHSLRLSTDEILL